MIEFSLYPDDTLRTSSALYACSTCPPPGELCPDWDENDPRQREQWEQSGFSI
jgi:hypothetical protein